MLSTGGLVFVGLYLASLIFIGWLGMRAMKETSLREFYLGGAGFGTLVLFLTMYATQYSGNSLIGFAGSAYRNGWFFLVSVTFMMIIVLGYLVYAPRLYPLAQKHGFITVGDYIHHRYRSLPLTLLVVIIGIWALANYMLTNLKAIGYVVELASGGLVGFETGIIVMAVIMVIYETLGGMRSVAWTDAIQGILLFAGVMIIFGAVTVHYGSPFENFARLQALRPELFRTPELADAIQWLSTLILIFFGISVYPQAIQRIYAAKDTPTLMRSLQLMVLMPLFTTLPLLVIALIGAAHFPGLDKAGSDRIVLLMLEQMQHLPGMDMVITLFVEAAVAAIMSTVDSAMLAIASLFTQDIYHRVYPDASEKQLAVFGKLFSWGMMALMVLLAIKLPATLWHLIQIKLEILAQSAPAVMLGVWMKRLEARALFWGALAGVGVTLFFLLSPLPDKPLGFHAGVWGLAANFAVIFFLNRRFRY